VEPEAHAAAPPVLRMAGITKSYPMAGKRLEVLTGVDLEVGRGSLVAVLGASGAGKSTLLHVAGGLDGPDAGRVWVGDRELTAMDAGAKARFRAERLGFVFQFHHLLPEFTALENVMMPGRLARRGEAEVRERATEVLWLVGLGERLDHRPAQLSGGEQQRVAVARAMVNRPELLLADEPSGNLDRDNAARLHELLVRLATEQRQTVVVATHNVRLARLASAVLALDAGKVRPAATEELEYR
jgi:lipoprotein-releasing system ATP-binding protein